MDNQMEISTNETTGSTQQEVQQEITAGVDGESPESQQPQTSKDQETVQTQELQQEITAGVDGEDQRQIEPEDEEHHGQEKESETVEKNTEVEYQEKQQPPNEQEHKPNTENEETPLYENQLNQFTTMAEVATKIFFLRQMNKKKREYIFSSFPSVLSETVFDTVSQRSMFPLSRLDSVGPFMDQYLLKLRLSFSGPVSIEDKLFGYVKDRVQSMQHIQLKLHSILAKFPFSSTAFSTKVMHDHYYYEGFFDLKRDVISTFLTPLRQPRKVSFDTNIPQERFDQELTNTFHFEHAEKKGHLVRPWNRFEYLVLDNARFYQEIFIENSVISCRNLIKLPTRDEFMRIKLYEEHDKMFLEELKFDKLFKLTTIDNRVQVSPYSSETGYPRYHDYFRITPPLSLDEYKRFNCIKIENVVAEIIGVDWGIIHKPSEEIGEENEQWFCCSDRVELFKAISVDPHLFDANSDDEDEDEDKNDSGEKDNEDSGDEDSAEEDSSSDEDSADEDEQGQENDKDNENENCEDEQTQTVDDDFTFRRIVKKEEEEYIYTFTTTDEKGKNPNIYELQFGIIHSKKDIQFYNFDEDIYDLHQFHHKFIQN